MITYHTLLVNLLHALLPDYLPETKELSSQTPAPWARPAQVFPCSTQVISRGGGKRDADLITVSA